jgi:hydroxymethylpyrimidine pyrophosphatase-like HAD family hydrolase
MNYRLLGIDLDGTLLDDAGKVSRENKAALARAHDAGLMVVPCTGRAWHESNFVLRGLPGIHLGVFITGACVANIADGQSVDLALIEPHLAHQVVGVLADEPEAVLVFRESAMAGHHYLVTGNGELTDNTRWWFEVTGAGVHFMRNPGPKDLHHTLRVGMVAPGSRIKSLERKVTEALGDRVQVHSFAALKRADESETVAVLEVFAGGAHKWRGLSWVAQQHGIEPGQVATIGDEVNDVAMLRHAGCGIAMGNAAAVAREAADRVTLPNTQHGVAHAIDRLLAGEW